MRHLLTDPRAPDASAIGEAADVLRRGGIVGFPTDTLYGLAVDPRNDDAVRRLFEAKGRPSDAAIALIAADAEQAKGAGTLGPAEARLAAEFWPGPLTIVLPANPELSQRLTGDRRTVGVRVPAHAVARALAAAFGWCITATSANISGGAPAETGDQVAAVLDAAIDLLLDAGPTPGGPPSTVLQIVEGRPTLHRPGAVAWDRVLRCLQ